MEYSCSLVFILLTKTNFMIHVLPTIAFLIGLLALFVREVKRDQKRFVEKDRLGDEHIMREIDKFLREKQLQIASTKKS